MKFVKSEKVIFSKDEYTLLEETLTLLEKVYETSDKNGEIKKITGNILINLSGLIYNENSDFE